MAILSILWDSVRVSTPIACLCRVCSSTVLLNVVACLKFHRCISRNTQSCSTFLQSRVYRRDFAGFKCMRSLVRDSKFCLWAAQYRNAGFRMNSFESLPGHWITKLLPSKRLQLCKTWRGMPSRYHGTNWPVYCSWGGIHRFVLIQGFRFRVRHFYYALV